MRYLGLDLGTKTLGVAISDPLGLIANDLTVLRHNEEYDRLILEVQKLVDEKKVEAIVLGFPKNMNNTIGERAQITLDFKEKLENTLHLPVYMQDERLTTRQAENLLIKNDTSRKKRKKVIDKVAATIILQSYLERQGK